MLISSTKLASWKMEKEQETILLLQTFPMDELASRAREKRATDQRQKEEEEHILRKQKDKEYDEWYVKTLRAEDYNRVQSQHQIKHDAKAFLDECDALVKRYNGLANYQKTIEKELAESGLRSMIADYASNYKNHNGTTRSTMLHVNEEIAKYAWYADVDAWTKENIMRAYRMDFKTYATYVRICLAQQLSPPPPNHLKFKGTFN